MMLTTKMQEFEKEYTKVGKLTVAIGKKSKGKRTQSGHEPSKLRGGSVL